MLTKAVPKQIEKQTPKTPLPTVPTWISLSNQPQMEGQPCSRYVAYPNLEGPISALIRNFLTDLPAIGTLPSQGTIETLIAGHLTIQRPTDPSPPGKDFVLCFSLKHLRRWKHSKRPRRW
jgi:hypothetical protein